MAQQIPKFDPKKPHADIIGITANEARFKQNGIYYRADGRPCDDDVLVLPGATEQDPVPGRNVAPVPLQTPVKPAETQGPKSTHGDPNVPGTVRQVAPRVIGPDDFAKMGADELKPLVLDAGGSYTNKPEAVAFLTKQFNERQAAAAAGAADEVGTAD